MNSNLQEKIKLEIKKSLLKAQIPGAAIAIRINSNPFLETGIGYQDLHYKTLLSTDANFFIYSITKTLLATASLFLIKKDLLNLDTPINIYLSDFPLDTSITLRQLLSHTSGLPDYGEAGDYINAVKTTPNSPWSIQTFLNFAQTQGLQFLPGQGWKYSNIGYLLLKNLLEKVTNLSLQQLLQQVIFSPLSLQKTFVANTLDDASKLTLGYSTFFNENKLQNVTRIYHPGWVAHGVVASTAPELAKIIDALFTNKLLDPLSVEEMICPVHILGKYPLFELLGYGLGLFVDVNSSFGKVAGHTGEGPGYSVAAFHFPNLAGYRATIAALTNRDKQNYALVLLYKIARLLSSYIGNS